MSGMNDGFTVQGLLKGLTPLHIGSAASDAPPALYLQEAEPTKAKGKTNRCVCCSKKLVLSDMGCSKCGNRYCSTHRLPELHACPHDFRKEGQALLEKQNPRVIGDKMERC